MRLIRGFVCRQALRCFTLKLMSSMAIRSSTPNDASAGVKNIQFIRRGEVVTLSNVPPSRTLLDVLREDLACSGTKEGCGEGDCGACTVVLADAQDGALRFRAINSCIRLAHSIDGMALWTVEDIATEADIAPRTFFYYFSTKEDVVLADYASRLDRITGELGQRPAAEASWTALRASFVVVAADYSTKREELVRRFVIMAANPSVYARSLQLQAGWEEALAGVLSDRIGETAADIEPRLMAAAALACMRSSLQHWLLTGHETSLPELIEGCFDRLANGLATDS